jgi:histidyl-tRNA synthetase
MAEKKKFQAIKGTRDLLPPDTELWSRVEATAREVFGTFGFGEIRPPIFEPTELFARAVGGETDIVSKEMYTFEDKPVGLPDFDRESFDFIQSATDVIARFETAELPQSPWNEVLIKFLKLDLPRWATAQAKLGPAETVREDVEELNKIASRLITHVKAVQLGELSSLRPEATASVCRAYIEHGMHAWPQPVKLYYVGPMFRRERPQKGRYRQFYQIGAEVLETVQPGQGGAKDVPKDAAVDAEVIEMVMTFFARLGLEGVQLEINSIGHAAENCRRGYVQKLKAALEQVKDKLGPDSRRRLETNPLRVLDSKLESEQVIIAGLPKIAEHLCDDCAKQYAGVKRQLDLRGVKYAENWRLVRGLDYYMRTTFEITAKGLGSQNAVCGGGRYDGLVELLGGLPTKGIGFAIGEDRLILSLQEQQREVAGGEWRVAREENGEERGKQSQERKAVGAKIPCDVYVAWMGTAAQPAAIHAAQRLRAAGVRVELPPLEQKFGKALGQADKLGAKYALILGEDEAATGVWTVKMLADGSQTKMSEAEFLEEWKREVRK